MTILTWLSPILEEVMAIDIELYHKKTPSVELLALPRGFWHLGTCLRSIVISSGGKRPDCLKTYDVYRNEGAYEFLLQVICGLHSPLIGETEILGQFKEFIRQNQTHFSSGVRLCMQSLLTEVKSLRTTHLQNLGCTSYGSLLRKHMGEDAKSVHFIGAGLLTQDILPWIFKDKKEIQVFTRSPEKYTQLKDKFRELRLNSLIQLKEQPTASVLIIAAPLSASEIHNWVDIHGYKKIFDLRGDSHRDCLESEAVIPLQTLFANIESNKVQAETIKRDVLQEIKKSTQKMRLIEMQRPFGWEDLWSYA